jgi:hypothetical protein
MTHDPTTCGCSNCKEFRSLFRMTETEYSAWHKRRQDQVRRGLSAKGRTLVMRTGTNHGPDCRCAGRVNNDVPPPPDMFAQIRKDATAEPIRAAAAATDRAAKVDAYMRRGVSYEGME